MRKLALLLLLTLPVFAAKFENIVVRNGDTTFNDGDAPRLRDLGRRYAYFEKDGVAYVITDANVLKQVFDELQPQIDLGREQARIGEEQARVGGLQAAVGGEQAALGAQQASHWDEPARMRELEAKQRKLQRRQAELQEQQRPLAELQEVLAEKQRVESSRARKRLANLFDGAVRSGVAKRR